MEGNDEYWLLNIYDSCAFRKKRNTHLFSEIRAEMEKIIVPSKKNTLFLPQVISVTSLLLELGIQSSHPEFMWFSSRSFGNLCYCDYLKLDHKVWRCCYLACGLQKGCHGHWWGFLWRVFPEKTVALCFLMFPCKFWVVWGRGGVTVGGFDRYLKVRAFPCAAI